MMKIELCIFDMDGLIFDTEKVYIEEFPKILKEYGYILNKDKLIKTLGMNSKSCREYYENLFPGINFTKMEDILENRLKSISKEGKLTLMKGVLELLEYLKYNNINCALASSSRKDKILQFLNDNNIMKYFKYVISGEDIINGKPNPEIFEKCMEYFNVSPENVYIFEDSYNGIRAANASKANAIMIPDILNPDEEMEKLSYKIFDNLLLVIKEFERIKNG